MNYVILFVTAVAAASIWLRIELARREEVREAGRRDRFRQQASADPTNAAAREELGDSLARAGLYLQAREAYLGALALGKETSSQERTRYKLQQVDLNIRRRADVGKMGPFGIGEARKARESYFCPQCGSPNRPTSRDCETCGASLPTNTLWEALRDREVQRTAWECLGLFVLMLVILHIFASLSRPAKGTLVIGCAAVMIWRFLQSIEGRRRI